MLAKKFQWQVALLTIYCMIIAKSIGINFSLHSFTHRMQANTSCVAAPVIRFTTSYSYTEHTIAAIK